MKTGINLGTSNSLISYWSETTQASKLITHRFGNQLTPSVVTENEADDSLVGQLAQIIQAKDLNKAGRAFKQELCIQIRLQVGSHKNSPIELSSMLLNELKHLAAAELNRNLADSEFVIGVPTYFNARQREASIQAAQMAGMTNVQLIFEPTAAALTYGIQDLGADKTFLVVDFGGGTFDDSLISNFEGIIQVEAIAGDSHLGCEDFTNAIADYVMEQLPVEPETLTNEERQLIYDRLELAKRQFSQGTLGVEIIIKLREKKYEVTLGAVKFKELVMLLLSRLTRPVERVFRDAKIRTQNGSTDEIDEMVMIGGGSYLKVV